MCSTHSVASGNPEATEEIVPFLTDESDVFAGAAAKALSQIRDARALAFLRSSARRQKSRPTSCTP